MDILQGQRARSLNSRRICTASREELNPSIKVKAQWLGPYVVSPGKGQGTSLSLAWGQTLRLNGFMLCPCQKDQCEREKNLQKPHHCHSLRGSQSTGRHGLCTVGKDAFNPAALSLHSSGSSEQAITTFVQTLPQREGNWIPWDRLKTSSVNISDMPRDS